MEKIIPLVGFHRHCEGFAKANCLSIRDVFIITEARQLRGTRIDYVLAVYDFYKLREWSLIKDILLIRKVKIFYVDY